MKIIKIILLLLVIGVLVFFGARYYAYNFGERNIQVEEAKYNVSSAEIVSEFSKDLESANKKYLEKPIIVSGKVTAIAGNSVIIDQSINCVFENADTSIKENVTVQIKGRVVGYDDLLGELKLDMCNQIKN